jgi:pyruvate-formate lyase-activating enzyme
MPADRPTRAVLKLTYHCNARCTFCRVEDFRSTVPDVPAEAVLRKAMAARDLGVGMIIFSGGEATLRDDLPTLAKGVRALGLEWGLITNGQRLAYGPYRDRLLGLGLAYVHTSLHGATAATHDGLVQCGASFDRVLEALAGLAGRVELHVNTVIARANRGELQDITRLLARFVPVTHKLCLAEPRGMFLAHEAEVAVPPHQAAAAAVAAVQAARSAAAPFPAVTVEGFPTCQVRPVADAVSGLRGHDIRYMSEGYEDALFPTDHGTRVFPDACAGCLDREGCPGVYPGYAERWGSEGLEPRR